jgi:hypothetical protein
MSLLVILLILIVLFGGVGYYGHGAGWGPYGWSPVGLSGDHPDRVVADGKAKLK